MTDEERARKIVFGYGLEAMEKDDIKRDILAAVAAARAEALEEAAQIAEQQPYYFDTHTGMRQQWVKDEIARKVRAHAGPQPQESEP